ncbi:MAG: lipopolysaccharide kinase InaA family protein [Planctomycetota bacterium]
MLKEDLTSRVERVLDEGRSLIRKTYTPRPFFLWRTFLAPSKARREHDNLRALVQAGVPVTAPIAWRETRVLGCVPSCQLWLADAGDVPNLKAMLGGDLALGRRRSLLVAFGRLLRRLHAAGFVSLTAFPRNVVVTGDQEDGLLWCDQPYLVRRPVDANGAAARLDLFDALFTPGRASMLSRGDKMRTLVAYAGSAAAAAVLWRPLVRRSAWWQRFVKGWVKIGCRLGVWSSKP